MLGPVKGFNFNMKYFDELKRSMEFLGEKKDTIFIGQAVEVPGTAMSNTLKNINKKKLIELPVAEEMQMGMSLGLAMDGNIPISIFPRWNFLLYGVNQLINHIDKFKVMNGNELKPKIIIRNAVGTNAVDTNAVGTNAVGTNAVGETNAMVDAELRNGNPMMIQCIFDRHSIVIIDC